MGGSSLWGSGGGGQPAASPAAPKTSKKKTAKSSRGGIFPDRTRRGNPQPPLKMPLFLWAFEPPFPKLWCLVPKIFSVQPGFAFNFTSVDAAWLGAADTDRDMQTPNHPRQPGLFGGGSQPPGGDQGFSKAGGDPALGGVQPANTCFPASVVVFVTPSHGCLCWSVCL